MADDSEELLQFRAEIFRSKLIEHFHLLDNFTDNSAEEVPKYYSDELKHDSSMNEMMRNYPNALVRFEVYSQPEEMTYRDRRLNRIKTKNTIPLGPWSKMVVENSKVQNFMLLLIMSNSIVLGIQAGAVEFGLSSTPLKVDLSLFGSLIFIERGLKFFSYGRVKDTIGDVIARACLKISQTPKESLRELKVFLNIFDYLSLMIFVLEILLKWIDGFVDFWKNGWNVFDFLVTIMSFVPELIRLSPGQNANQGVKLIADNLRTFRILRSLKMVSRFAQLRIIVLTILKALKSMAFILMLLATFMYIFAVTGTVMFTSHAKSKRADVVYQDSFSNLVNSLLTLFQLFTLDRWYEILTDLGKAANDLFSKVYILLWICVGAFIFKNVFTGIMVMNFQNIRNDFIMQCKEHEQAIKEEENKRKLEEELAKQYRSHGIARRQSSAVTSLYGQQNAFLAAKFGVPDELIEEEEEDESVSGDNESGKDVLVEIDKPTESTSIPQDNSPLPSVSPGIAKQDTKERGPFDEDHAGSEVLTTPTQLEVTELPEKQEQLASESSSVKDAEHRPPITSKFAWGEGIDEEPESFHPEEEVKEDENSHFKEYQGSAVWNSTITQNLSNMKINSTETLWPKDSLFDYFQLMEVLQDNLAERHQLQKLAVLALNQIHDGELK